MPLLDPERDLVLDALAGVVHARDGLENQRAYLLNMAARALVGESFALAGWQSALEQLAVNAQTLADRLEVAAGTLHALSHPTRESQGQ